MLFNCKFCGGELEITEGDKITTCKYCRTTQTLPIIKDERESNLFNRANALRRRCDFDKAEAAFEKIIEADGTEAEAYWGLVLSKYGIEYVDDKATGKMIPTCHRASYDSVIADEDYKSALEYADTERKALYIEQAKEIDRIQKEILTLAENEEKYDVFICYKETDENGKRTHDSARASEIYYELTDAGFKVFYAAVTLDGKIGSQYEPIIFSALNSAKVMLVIGSKPEYFNAVWVKNEWSRFLKIMKNDRKKRLIPCYYGMDAYDLPEEFVHIQAQNMEKMAFLIDLIQGVKKVMEGFKKKPEVIVKEKETVLKETVVNQPVIHETVKETTVIRENGGSAPISAGGTNTSALLRRVFMFLEDGNFKSADEYCEKVLDLDPENAEAYLGKLMAELKVKIKENLKHCEKTFDININYKKILRFGNEALKTELQGYIDFINTRNENARLEAAFSKAIAAMSSAKSESEFKEAAKLFDLVKAYKDSADKAKKCLEKAEEAKRRAEEERRRAEEEKKRCDALLVQLKEIYRNGDKNEAKKSEVSRRISALTNEINNLTALKNKWHQIETEISSVNGKIAEKQNEISKYNTEKASLGFFAGKRKKELAEQIASAEYELSALRQKLPALSRQRQGYVSLADVSGALDGKETNLAKEKSAVVELSKLKGVDGIRAELNSCTYGKDVLNAYDKLNNIKGAKIGDCIKFGKYKQSSKNASPEDIEWQVLDRQGDKALVISKHGLDCKKYNETQKDVTWETCTLRKWLNNDFINTAFTAAEKKIIPTVTVSADRNPSYSTDPGNATQDKVFLLSIPEAEKYFGSEAVRVCKPTEYAKAQGANTKSSSGNCWWWLRSPGDYQDSASYICSAGYVESNGGRTLVEGYHWSLDGDLYDYYGDLFDIDSVDDNGNYICFVNYAVRPAMWIDLNV